MNTWIRIASCTLLITGAAAAAAQPTREAYKHVDEQGRVTYSQTAPADNAKKVELPPPRKATYPSRDFEREALRRQERMDRTQQAERDRAARHEAIEEARKKRADELKAECVRNRGTDCNDPETLKRMEADRQPTRYRPTAIRH